MALDRRKVFLWIGGGGVDVAHSLESIAEAADQVPPASRSGFRRALAWLVLTVPVALVLGFTLGRVAVLVWVAMMIAAAFWWSSQFGADRRTPS